LNFDKTTISSFCFSCDSFCRYRFPIFLNCRWLVFQIMIISHRENVKVLCRCYTETQAGIRIRSQLELLTDKQAQSLKFPPWCVNSLFKIWSNMTEDKNFSQFHVNDFILLNFFIKHETKIIYTAFVFTQARVRLVQWIKRLGSNLTILSSSLSAHWPFWLLYILQKTTVLMCQNHTHA
jgi:hypothetical protein